ncbi:hypothetical protein GX408_16230 [bacterium]|nr:hypothetical protein [bacterium]
MKTEIFILVLICAGTAIAGPAAALERTITVMDLSGDWEAEGDLPWQAMLLSLQGLANQHGPHLYFLHPENYIHPDVRAVLDYYQTRHRMKAVTCRAVDEVVAKYVQYAKGYVVWDPTKVPSLMVSFTVAGLEQALVVTEAYIPLAEKHGLKPIVDFRNQFAGQSDLEIFQWAYDTYWPRCSREYLIYLGERCTGLNGRPGLMPGIADFGIVHKAFFTDLSASPADPDEYRLADKIMSEMKPYGYVYGWHSYCKDKEPEHLTLLSRHGLIISEGLATLPNMSFHGQVPVSADFRFKQKAGYNPHPKIENKVYLAMIQSDGMGTGSTWMKPGRGEIPYGWEANEEWFTTAPALLQFYYESATANDRFIGSLSGPGYFYPKVFAPDKLAGALQRENELMKKMDLRVFGIMDFSEGDEFVGNIDLPQSIVDVYYANIPYALGFINGYTAANTYACRNGRPLLSYNYYVDPEKPVEEVAEDLRELATLNPQRPYFLPVHVRETNTVRRIKTIMDQLGPEFQIVPPEELMIMAGEKPTMITRFLDHHPDFSGHWQLNPKQSKNTYWIDYELDIDHRDKIFSITTTARYSLYVHHRELKTAKTLVIGGPAVGSLEELPRRMEFLAAQTDSIRTRAEWDPDGKTLVLTSDMMLQTSQGFSPLTTTSRFTLSEDAMTLTVSEHRLSRKSPQATARYIYRRVL